MTAAGEDQIMVSVRLSRELIRLVDHFSIDHGRETRAQSIEYLIRKGLEVETNRKRGVPGEPGIAIPGYGSMLS